MDEKIRHRLERASESILENEQLTTDLDDEAASQLLDWGLAWTKDIVLSTAGLSDPEAEEAISNALRNLRHLLRSVSRWAISAQEMSEPDRITLLSEITEHVEAVRGKGSWLVDEEQQTKLLHKQAERAIEPAKMISELRTLFEDSTSTTL